MYYLRYAALYLQPHASNISGSQMCVAYDDMVFYGETRQPVNSEQKSARAQEAMS